MKPEEKKEMFYKFIKRIFLVLLISFTALYISGLTGYYEYEQNQNVTLTSYKIKQFEEDVKNGEKIDISNYINEKKDYSSKTSKLGLDISTNIKEMVTDSLNEIFKFLGKAAEEK